MSLMYEALQKAEREKDRKTASVSAPATPPQPTVTTATPPQAHRRPVAVIIAISLVAVVAAGAIVFLIKDATKPPVVQPTTSVAPVTAAPPVPTEHRAPDPAPAPTENDSRFKLTGISGTPDGGFVAFINGRVVSVDQYVDGVIVKKIERDRVTLDLNGREIMLRLF